MKAITVLVALQLLIFSMIAEVRAQTVEIRGSLRGWLRGFSASPNEIDLAQTRLKLELLSAPGKNIAFLARSYFTHHGLTQSSGNGGSRVDVNLQEAYIDYYSDLLSVRFGRQIMAWGKADEINPTDILNPQDMSNILEDKIIRKTGLFAVKANWLFNDFNLETIWKPLFKPMTLPAPGSRWGLFPMTTGTQPPPEILPGHELDETEWAVKLSRTISMFDISVSWFDGWDNIPTTATLPDSSGELEPHHLLFHRTRMIGAEFAGSIGSVGIWNETAYFSTSDHEGKDPLVKNPYIQTVIGSDYTFGCGLKVNIQFVQEFLLMIDNDAERDAEEAVISKLGIGMPLQQALTGRIAMPFGFGETHSVELFGIYDIKENGLMLGPRLMLSPEEAVKLEVGAVILGGDDGSMFGRMDGNDNLYVKFTYSF